MSFRWLQMRITEEKERAERETNILNRLPSALDSLSFSVQFRGTPIQVTLTDDRLTLAAHPEGGSRPVRVGVGDDVRELCPGDRTVFELSQDPATTGPSARN